ncbi:branched-chain amino acid ABC transporter permease [Sedimentibacter hydroxybenzoicus DSM 7310]|uniref:Branched-chain amino acid ABC transporter permease n=1 Tax=Sedimentibacter hydroxybenzoicus DSM 7310 TaxID=1123245 RepID=A0A974BKE4_SEDHY|nr:branched-chain amino acid ABC transporter permease [Sedimentibacter hydroxybenzoicus]NYB74491.1 branched-chain amino acid ABC transporter permease [Sedimentibacter hydroxybenzoicus DSM 7310]
MVKNKKTLIIIIAVLAALPLIFKSDSFHNIMVLLLIYATLGEAWNIITGFAGQISFGHAAFFGIGAYTSSVLFYRFDISPWVGMVLGGIFAAMVALIISYPTFRLKGSYFAIATLAVAEIIKQLFVSWKFVEGATGISLPIVDDSWLCMEFHTTKLPYIYIALGLFAIVIFVCNYIENSKTGFYLKAIRESHEVAESIGINTTNYKTLAMVISAFISAFAGSLYAQYVLYIDPFMIFTLDISIKIVLLTVLGGIGNIYGPLIGASILIPLSEITRVQLGGTGRGIDLMIFGLLVILVACYQPKGIIGLVNKVAKKFKKEGEGNVEANS